MSSRSVPIQRTVRIRSPHATQVRLVVRSCHPGAPDVVVDARPEHEDGGAGWWVAQFHAEPGDLYWLVVDDGPALLDPSCHDLALTAEGPRSVMREPWEPRPAGRALAAPAIVYEAHVKGLGGGYLGCIERLDHIASTGANVLELMPVHPFDDHDNYWGYMPLVWGAVHRGYAQRPERAAEELAELVAAAHQRGMHVWLDVVFNHLGEGDAAMPVRSIRGMDEAAVYRHHADGRPTNDSGCGNDIDPADPWVRRLVIDALDRYADLGVDGFRFDLASLLTRDGGGLVTRITEWADTRGVLLVAEPWDLGAYQVGHGWPWPTWLQWNDRFRDTVRGLLRGENGWVRAVRQRVQGSPDLFGPDGAARTINFIDAHDGLTLHDLTTVTSDRHHSWDCGPELRMQQLKNYFALLLLSAGTPMWVMGDEFARSQQGHDNPYDIDGPTTWVDWTRATTWSELTDFVRTLVALRRRHPMMQFHFHGVGPTIDLGFLSHSLAWRTGDLYVMVNAWWEPLTFEVQGDGPWTQVAATAAPGVVSGAYTLAPRSVVVLER